MSRPAKSDAAALTPFERLRRPYRAAMTSPSGVRLVVATVQRSQRGRLASAATDLVIDGFPRSANTFAVHALRHANPDARLAHHLHCAGHLLLGVRLGLPTVAVLRDPVGAVLSEAIRDERRSLAGLLDDWHHLYAAIEPQLDGIVLAPFEVTIEDFGQVVDAVNDRFGTSFTRFEATPEHRAEVTASIDRAVRAKWTSRTEQERRAPRPSDERTEERARLEADLDRAELRGSVDRARRLHERLLARARPVT